MKKGEPSLGPARARDTSGEGQRIYCRFNTAVYGRELIRTALRSFATRKSESGRSSRRNNHHNHLAMSSKPFTGERVEKPPGVRERERETYTARVSSQADQTHISERHAPPRSFCDFPHNAPRRTPVQVPIRTPRVLLSPYLNEPKGPSPPPRRNITLYAVVFSFPYEAPNAHGANPSHSLQHHGGTDAAIMDNPPPTINPALPGLLGGACRRTQSDAGNEPNRDDRPVRQNRRGRRWRRGVRSH